MTPRRADANQSEIVQTLRMGGANVAHTHELGQGFPDVCVGVDGLTLVGQFDIQQVHLLLEGIPGLVIHEGANLLVEIKDGSKPPSKRKLTERERVWHQWWRGQVAIVESVDDALDLIGR